MYVFRVGFGVVGSFCDVEVLRNVYDFFNYRVKEEVWVYL